MATDDDIDMGDTNLDDQDVDMRDTGGTSLEDDELLDTDRDSAL
ncbi:MAG TPA: hypothetical protein VFI84_03805 [Candidatus Saccharimonadales bacterium]|nr:hypothetical protein [Candidatus Saccharimonadales bacterium]